MKNFDKSDFDNFHDILFWIEAINTADFPKDQLVKMLAFQLVDNELELKHNQAVKSIYDTLKKQ
jgi:hypothetical protein